MALEQYERRGHEVRPAVPRRGADVGDAAGADGVAVARVLGVAQGGEDDALLGGHDCSTLAAGADARDRAVTDRPGLPGGWWAGDAHAAVPGEGTSVSDRGPPCRRSDVPVKRRQYVCGVRAVLSVVDRWLERVVDRIYEDVLRRVGRRPGAAGSMDGLQCCERTSDGWVCRWARARVSPEQLMQLGHDLRSIVGGEDAAVEVQWGQRLRRGYSPEEASKLPIASLRNARQITVSATGTPPGPSARVSISRSEPALEAAISGLSDVADDLAEDIAQRVKDAAGLGRWNPVSGEKLGALSGLLVLYLAAFALIFVVQPTGWLLIAALTLAVVVVGFVMSVVMIGLYPPMQIVAGDQSRVIALLKGAVPVLAGVATVVVTVLKLAGGS